MNPYFPLVGLFTFVAVGLAIVKYMDYQGRLNERDEELERKKAEAATAAPESRSRPSN